MADAKAIANALTAMLQPMVATITATTTAAVATAAPTVPPIAPVIVTRTPAQARADPLNKVTMVKPRSIIALMLVGADTLATSWQMTGDFASSPIWQANHNVAQIFQAEIKRLCSKRNEGDIPAELFLLATQQQQNNDCSLIAPPSLFFGPPMLEEFHTIMNSLIHIQDGIDMSTTQGYTSQSSMMIFFNAQDDPESPPLVEGPFTMTSPPCNKEPPQGQQQPSHITSCLSPAWLQTSHRQLQEQQPTKETILNDGSNNHWKLFAETAVGFPFPQWHVMRQRAQVDGRSRFKRHWVAHTQQTLVPRTQALDNAFAH
jgi:hypothetical protein